MNFVLQMSGATASGTISPETAAQLGLMLGGFFAFACLFGLALLTLMIVSRRRVFEKAGLPGWGAIIPGYNFYLIFELGGRSGRNVLWLLIPPVFGILMIINYFRIAKRFGKHWTFGLGMLLLKCIFVPILAFDSSRYQGGKTTFSRSRIRPQTLPMDSIPTIAKSKGVSKKPLVKKPTSKKLPAKKVIKKKVVKK